MQTTLDDQRAGPGAFDLINIDGSRGGTSPGTLASWIQNGCACTTTAPVWLYSDPGAKFNSSQVQSAMDRMVGHTLLFPVYDTHRKRRQPPIPHHRLRRLHDHLLAAKGTSATITGSFTKVDWGGTGTTSGSNYFGATTTPSPANTSPHGVSSSQSAEWPLFLASFTEVVELASRV